MASPDTVILLIMDCHAAIGDKTRPVEVGFKNLGFFRFLKT